MNSPLSLSRSSITKSSKSLDGKRKSSTSSGLLKFLDAFTSSSTENMLTRNPGLPRGPINHEHIVIKYEPPPTQKTASPTPWAASGDSDTGSTDSGRPPSLAETKSPRPTSLSSVSSGSSRASYLSDSLRLGALTEEVVITKVDHIIDEIIQTEVTYIESLGDLIRGYLRPLRKKAKERTLPILAEEIELVFGNIEQLETFHRTELSLKRHRSPSNLADMLILNSDKFKEMYTFYCTNMKMASDVLREINDRPDVREFIENQRRILGHPKVLDVSTFLLKPFQRLTKYPDLLKKLTKELGNQESINMAVAEMTNVANHINEVQRENEDRHMLQEFQALLLNYDGPELTRLGEFCMDGEVFQGKQERYILLFHKLFILLKWHHDRLEVRHQITTDNLIVLEGEDRSFQVTPFDDIKNKICLTTKTVEEKKLWCHHLKRLMMENHPAPVPSSAKSKILNAELASRPNRRLHRMSSLPILDRDKKRRSMKGGKNFGESSSQRYVQSLPRSSGSSALKVTPISLLPPRAHSFHRKSGSTGGLTSTPLKKREILLDCPLTQPPTQNPIDLSTPFTSEKAQPTAPKSQPEPRIPSTNNPLPASTPATPAPLLKSISLSSDSEEDEQDHADVFSSRNELEINSSEEEKSKNKSTQNTPLRQRHRAPPRRSRTIGGGEVTIRPGKVAEILHRFSSTNRGAIRSVYYDSNSDSECSSAMWKDTTDDDDEIDHLSKLLDETLDDLDCDEDYDTE